MEKKFTEQTKYERANSMGLAQIEMEAAAKNLVSKQAALSKAAEDHTAAEKRYTDASAALNAEYSALRTRTKIISLASK